MALNRTYSLLITLGFLVLAVACYMVGLALPGAVFFILGGAFELAFWIRVLRRRR